jgi:precorrin-6B methylase 2
MSPSRIAFDRESLDRVLHRLFIGAPGAGLRDEDRCKVHEMQGFLAEIAATVARRSRRQNLVMVDAAAGKSVVGLLAAELILAPLGRPALVHVIERDPLRVAACRQAASRLQAPGIEVVISEADVADAQAWPARPDVVVALHACGPASDLIIDQAIVAQARDLLLVPCCTSKHVAAAALAERHADALEIPRHAEVRRRFIQSIVDAERTLRLEAAGWQTTVVAFVAPTVTPHNLLWRCQHVGEPGRMAEAARHRDRLLRV